MANKPKTVPRRESGLTVPGELYVDGDKLPLPEVTEKNTDSVWALWSGLTDENEEPDETEKAELQKDFKETVPMDFDGLETTALMPLPDLPKEKDD